MLTDSLFFYNIVNAYRQIRAHCVDRKCQRTIKIMRKEKSTELVLHSAKKNWKLFIIQCLGEIKGFGEGAANHDNKTFKIIFKFLAK